jgi:hypothetical protein
MIPNTAGAIRSATSRGKPFPTSVAGTPAAAPEPVRGHASSPANRIPEPA